MFAAGSAKKSEVLTPSKPARMWYVLPPSSQASPPPGRALPPPGQALPPIGRCCASVTLLLPSHAHTTVTNQIRCPGFRNVGSVAWACHTTDDLDLQVRPFLFDVLRRLLSESIYCTLAEAMQVITSEGRLHYLLVDADLEWYGETTVASLASTLMPFRDRPVATRDVLSHLCCMVRQCPSFPRPCNQNGAHELSRCCVSLLRTSLRRLTCPIEFARPTPSLCTSLARPLGRAALQSLCRHRHAPPATAAPAVVPHVERRIAPSYLA